MLINEENKTEHRQLLRPRLIGLLVVWLVVVCAACKPQVITQPTRLVESPTSQPVVTISPTVRILLSATSEGLLQAATPTASRTAQPLQPPTTTATLTATIPQPITTETVPSTVLSPPTLTQIPTSTSEEVTYPGPFIGYPGPENNPIGSYPGEAGGIFNSQGQVNPTLANTATQPVGIPTSTPTAPAATPSPTPSQQVTATRLPTLVSGAGFMPREIQAGAENPSLVIWHSWDPSQVAVLEEIVHLYQAAYPLVSVTLLYVPQDDLKASYASAVYLDQGPDVVLGPSDWGASFFDQTLAADLSVYFSQDFLKTISTPALATGMYKQAQVSLPYTMYGGVLYRNRKIIPQAPVNVEAFVKSAKQATRGGIVGAYLEYNAYFSMPHLLGMGGAWLDETGKPVFNRQDYSLALGWIDLLKALRGAGAVEVNTSLDNNLFQQGRVGFIFDGTWNLPVLAKAVGKDNLVIDTWPAYGSGRLAGFVQAQSLYLNPTTAARQDSRLAAALQFMAAMVSPQVQRRLAETGSIPASTMVQPTEPLLRQAQKALQNGVGMPPALQEPTRQVYWTAIDTSIRQALSLGQVQVKSPLEALKTAFDTIASRLVR